MSDVERADAAREVDVLLAVDVPDLRAEAALEDERGVSGELAEDEARAFLPEGGGASGRLAGAVGFDLVGMPGF